MSEERKERCNNCRFWWLDADGHEMDSTIRECHRFPPAPIGNCDNGPLFPMTELGNWCGEFQAEVKKTKSIDCSLEQFIESLPRNTNAEKQTAIRIRKALTRMQITRLEELCNKYADEVATWKNIGALSLATIRKTLATFGLKLKGE